jgi:multimeric flavodoxin WrbA
MDSNSDALADAFIKGACEAGHSVERVKLSEQEIHPCQACDHCRSHGFECIQDDDMQGMYDLLEDADTIVFATPLYFLTFPAQLKVFIDRLYCKFHGKKLVGKESALLVSYGSTSPTMSDNLLSTYHAICEIIDWKVMGHVIVSGYAHDGTIRSSAKLDEAYALGLSISNHSD